MTCHLAALALITLAPAGDPNPAWLLEYGLTGDALKKRAVALRADGYRPTSVTGYNLLEDSRFAVVWEKSKEAAWEMSWGLTPAALDKRGKDLKADGFRPIGLSGYDLVGAQGFIDLWRKTEGSDWLLEYGADATGLEQLAGRMKERGYRPRTVSSYVSGTISRYATLWEKGGDVAWDLKWGMSGGQLDSNLKSLGFEGFRPIAVSALAVEEEASFCAVWEKRKGIDWVVRHGVDGDGLATLGRTMQKKGYRPTYLSGYQTLRGVRFVSIWERDSGK